MRKGQPAKRHVIVNCFTPIDDGHLQPVPWLFPNSAEAQAQAEAEAEADGTAQMPIDFDHVVTRGDKDMLEGTDPDALVDMRRRGVEFPMEYDLPGLLIRKQLMERLGAEGRARQHGQSRAQPRRAAWACATLKGACC